MDYNTSLQQYPLFVIIIAIVVALWSVVWKGLALWRAAKRDSVGWFVLFLVLNTAGILEIIYLLVTSPKRQR